MTLPKCVSETFTPLGDNLLLSYMINYFLLWAWRGGGRGVVVVLVIVVSRLFNDAFFSSSDCTASNERVISER
jgi:hypothetical protein